MSEFYLWMINAGVWTDEEEQGDIRPRPFYDSNFRAWNNVDINNMRAQDLINPEEAINSCPSFRRMRHLSHWRTHAHRSPEEEERRQRLMDRILEQQRNEINSGSICLDKEKAMASRTETPEEPFLDGNTVYQEDRRCQTMPNRLSISELSVAMSQRKVDKIRSNPPTDWIPPINRGM